MITIVQKICNKINCMKLIPFNETYCEEHQYIKEQSKQNYQKKSLLNEMTTVII